MTENVHKKTNPALIHLSLESYLQYFSHDILVLKKAFCGSLWFTNLALNF